MNFKKPVLFGVILAIVVLVVTTAAWMANPAYADIAAIVTVVILTLLLTKFYVGKTSVTTMGMLTVGILWAIIAAIFDLVYASAFSLNLATYYSNYLIYVGYVLIIVLALVGQKIFGTKAAATAPAK